jgi:hypothetical protein
MTAFKILIVQNGLIVLSDITGDNVSKLTKKDVQINIVSSGLSIRAGELSITIPENIIDFFLEHPTITIYSFSAQNYIEEAIFSIDLSRESIIEARGIYNYWKKANLTAAQQT